LSQADINLRPE